MPIVMIQNLMHIICNALHYRSGYNKPFIDVSLWLAYGQISTDKLFFRIKATCIVVVVVKKVNADPGFSYEV